jgi:PAS domain S-box-containing protein
MITSSIGKVLVVDDEVELKNVLVEALSSQGYETAGFTSGEEALAALRGEAFDVLLTDLMMPGMDGITLMRESLQIDPHLVCMVMTGQGTIQTAVDAMKEGAFDYVLKPFRLQAVLPVLTRAMSTRCMLLENVQLRETVAIHELSQTIAFTLDPQATIGKLADAALQQTDADEVSVLLPTGEGSNELYVAAVRGENREKLIGERVQMDESISGWVARQREPLILDGEVNDQRFRSMWPHPEIRSAVSIPMQVAGKLVGVMNLNSLNRVRPFTLGQLKALSILAGTAAAALESASLYKQVQKAEENYRSIFENAIEGIFQSTPAGRFLTVNPAMARILGYDSPEEVIQEITDVAHQLYVDPEDRTKASRLEKATGILKNFEFEAYRKDGEKIWLSLNRHSIQDENGAELYREGSVEDITERKRAEEALVESQQIIEGILNAIPVRVFWKDKNLVYLGCNAAFARDAGFADPKDIIGKDDYQLAWHDWADVYRGDDRQVIESGSSKLLFEEPLTTPEGDTRTLLTSKVPLRSSAGEISGVLGTFMDITERKRLEAERERLAVLVEASPDFIGYADPKTAKIQYINKHGRRMCGIGEEEDLGTLKISDLHPAWMNHRMADVVLPAAVRDGVWEGDGAFLHRNGREIPVSMVLMARKAANGEVDIFYTVSRDITERKEVEKALRKSEESYRDLVENAHDIIFSHDLQGNYTSVNRAGEQSTGYTHEECLSLNIADTIAPEHIGKAREMMAKKLAGEVGTAYEVELLAKDGKRIAVEVNTKLILQEGVPVGVQGIARDVTERKQLEDQLRQSQKLEAIGQLAGGIAHDFNNLLTAINGYSSLALQRIEGNPTVKNYLEEIKKAGDRAANLTRQLLAFGRKQILQPLPLNLNDTVTDMNKMLRRLIGEDIQLSAKLAPDLKRVTADPGQIEQVLVNLVVNARDAMPQGGNLTIETANTDLDREYASKHDGVHPGAFVVLAVSDTGTGMNAEVRRHIFEPFFTTKEKGKGTGLGLSTVYGIVKQSGGNISIYSEPNHGTTFKVYLPALDSVAKSSGTKTDEIVTPKGSETILLVEDEEVVRGLACQILEEAGYRVLVAPRGEEAIRLGREHAKEIHLLLTDVVMPSLDGKQVADRLSSSCPGIKVLFMSGYTDEAIVHHGILDADVKFIQKPFTPAALATKVRDVLDSNGKMSIK